MLAAAIEDNVESGAGRVDGLGLLPATVCSSATGKTVGRPHGSRARRSRWHGDQTTTAASPPLFGVLFLDGGSARVGLGDELGL